MTLTLTVLSVLVVGALLGLLAACRERPADDEGPWRHDERARGERQCPARSLFSGSLCSRSRGHRGRHDVVVRPDPNALVSSARR